MTRHLLASADLTPSEIGFLLEIALEFKRRPRRLLDGKHLALLFEKPSLRTRVSFQVGMHHLGGETLYLAPQEVGLGEREAIKDVARVLARYVDIVAVRTFGQGIVEEYACYSEIPVVNALTDEEHPCQALADCLTLKERWGDTRGRRLAFVGDGGNVATSFAQAAAMLGITVHIASPEGFELPESVDADVARVARSGAELRRFRDPAAAVRNVDAVYTDVWTSMGREAEVAVRRRLFGPYQVNDALMAHARSDACFLHCLPAHRGEEVTDSVLDSPASVVFDQAENRLHTQKALLLMLFED